MIYVHQMPDGCELVKLLSFPVRIREFAASVREIKDLTDKFGQISLSDQDAPKNTADPKYEADRRRKGKQVLSENCAEFQLALFDLNEYPADNEATTVHDKYAPENAEAPGTSGVKKQSNGKEAVMYQNSADSDYDSSRTISDLPSESMSLNHRQYEVVNKGTKIKSILKKSCQIARRYEEAVNKDDITRISLTKRKTVRFNLDDNNKKKKNKMHTALPANESPKSNKAEPSKRKGSSGPRGSRVAVGRVHKSKPLKRGPKRLKSSHNEMVKEVKCQGLGQCNAVGGCEPSGSNSGVVRAGKVNISGEMVQARALCSETLECIINQNPAEFSPKIAKTFLRWYR